MIFFRCLFLFFLVFLFPLASIALTSTEVCDAYFDLNTSLSADFVKCTDLISFLNGSDTIINSTTTINSIAYFNQTINQTIYINETIVNLTVINNSQVLTFINNTVINTNTYEIINNSNTINQSFYYAEYYNNTEYFSEVNLSRDQIALIAIDVYDSRENAKVSNSFFSGISKKFSGLSFFLIITFLIFVFSLYSKYKGDKAGFNLFPKLQRAHSSREEVPLNIPLNLRRSSYHAQQQPEAAKVPGQEDSSESVPRSSRPESGF